MVPIQRSDGSPEAKVGADEEIATQAEKTTGFSHGSDRTDAGAGNRGFGRFDYRIAAALVVVALLSVAAWPLFLSDAPTVQPPDNLYGPTIYVAPFEAVAPSAESLARGITTEMVSVLSEFVELRVYPVTANFVEPKPDSDNVPTQQRGFRLGGSVQIVGNDLRVTARLQDASDGLQVWSERYDTDYSPHNVFEIQDSIATEVARKLAEPFGLLRELSRETLSKRHDPSLAAYKCVLLGYQYRQRFSADLHESARSCLEQAIRTDPEYARAWALLAHIYADEYRAFYNTLPDARGRSLAAAQRAVELDPDDVLSYQALSVAQFINGPADIALDTAKKAVEMNPHNNEALFQLGMRTAFAGDWDQGFELAQRAITESPTAPTWYQYIPALYHYVKGDYEQARTAIEQIRLHDLALVEAGRAMIYGQLDMSEQADRALSNSRRLDPQFDRRARDWFAVHQIDDDTLDHFIQAIKAPAVAARAQEGVGVEPEVETAGSPR